MRRKKKPKQNNKKKDKKKKRRRKRKKNGIENQGRQMPVDMLPHWEIIFIHLLSTLC